VIKLCRICGEEQEHAIRKTGAPHTHCKRCQREYSRQHYAANKEKHNARRYKNQKRYRLADQELIKSVKSIPCTDCGVQYPHYVMDFDHLGDKEFTIGNTKGHYSRERLLREIAKCEVVCANCHRERTHKRRGVA
jgi:hypothetical protein